MHNHLVSAQNWLINSIQIILRIKTSRYHYIIIKLYYNITPTMARSPNHGSWHNQSRHDALHDHFATYSKSDAVSSSLQSVTSLTPLSSCIVEQEGSLSRTCHLDLPNQTKDLTPIQFTYSNFDALPNTSASTIDIQAWIQEFFFIGHGITVPENAIRKVTWDGADLWKIDVRSQGIAILDMIRWGFELEHAELFCEEVETWRERESGYVVSIVLYGVYGVGNPI